MGCRQSPNRDNEQNLELARRLADSAYDLMGGKNSAIALNYIDSTFRNLQQGPIVRWIRFRTIKDYYENYTNDTVAQHRYIDSMAQTLDSQPYRPEVAQTTLAHSRLLQAEQRYDEAFRELQNGSLTARQHGDNCGLADFYNHMGVIRYQQEQYRTAISYLRNALADDAGCALPNDFTYTVVMRQSLLNTTGLCYEKLGLADSAIHYYQQALRFILAQQPLYPGHRNFMFSAEGVIKGNLGGAYIILGNDSAAVRYLKDAIAINDRPGFAIEDAQNTKLKLAGLYLKKRQFVTAETVLNAVGNDLSKGRGRSTMRDEIFRDYLNAMSGLSQQRGDYRSAYHYSLTFHQVADSLHALKDQLIRADMDRLFAANSGRRLLETTARNGRLKTWLLVILVSCLLLVASAAVIGLAQLRRSRDLVSLLKISNKRLEDNIVELEKSKDENDRILKIIAHDLRNPLGAIYSATNLLSELDLRTESPETLINLIGECSHTAIDLVSELLNGSNALLKRLPVDMAGLLQDNVTWMQHHANAKHQQIQFTADHAEVVVDKRQIGRVICNLLSNAIKFSPPHTIIDVVGIRDEREYLVKIHDRGIGIPSHLLAKLFDAGPDIRRPGTAGEPSNGLGLGICRQFMQDHRGSIWVESASDLGTIVFLRFPLTAESAN